MLAHEYEQVLEACDLDSQLFWWMPVELPNFPPSTVGFVKRLFSPNRTEVQREYDLKKIMRRFGIQIDEVR